VAEKDKNDTAMDIEIQQLVKKQKNEKASNEDEKSKEIMRDQ